MTRKTKKFSLGVKIASILCCVALTAVGFASWLILKPAEKIERTGSFEVYTVEENNITITVTPDQNAVPTIVWGKSNRQAQSTDWLLASNYDGKTVQQESLTATFNVTVTSDKVNLVDSINSANVKFDMSAALSAYNAAVANGVIANPTITVDGSPATLTNGIASGTVTPDANDAKSLTFQVVVTFAWGANGNPYTYYNGQAYSDELAGKAKTALGLVAALEGQSYKLEVTTTPKS